MFFCYLHCDEVSFSYFDEFLDEFTTETLKKRYKEKLF